MIWLLTEKNASILCTCTGTTEARRWCSHVIAGFSNPTPATLRRCWWNWNVCCSAKCHLRSREWRSLSINLIMHQIMHNTKGFAQWCYHKISQDNHFFGIAFWNSSDLKSAAKAPLRGSNEHFLPMRALLITVGSRGDAEPFQVCSTGG